MQEESDGWLACPPPFRSPPYEAGARAEGWRREEEQSWRAEEEPGCTPGTLHEAAELSLIHI